jgi:hypothetical protein
MPIIDSEKIIEYHKPGYRDRYYSALFPDLPAEEMYFFFRTFQKKLTREQLKNKLGLPPGIKMDHVLLF